MGSENKLKMFLDNVIIRAVNENYDIKVLSEKVGHYRVGILDIWPSTGRFHNRATGEYGYLEFDYKYDKNESTQA